MPSSHDLKGLIKFLGRDSWNACFDEIFDAHFKIVLDTAEFDFDELAEILGDHVAVTLWGCAFEDFLTQEFDVDGGNIVDAYLKRRGWKEGARAKAYMKALRNSVMSLYEVSEIVPGESFLARDLLRGGEPVRVSEASATKMLRPWDRISARVVPVQNKNVVSGGILTFDPDACTALFDMLSRFADRGGAQKPPKMTDDVLRGAGPIFTLTWLFNTLDRLTADNRPLLTNADGDELLFHFVRFPILSGVTQKDVAARLDTVPGLERASAKFWNWLQEEDEDRPQSEKPAGMALDTTMDSGARVLGNVELKGRALQLSVNSEARAERGIALIEASARDLVGPPAVEVQTVDELTENRSEDSDAAGDEEMPPDVAAMMVHDYLDKHYRETLDKPVGMLGDMSPRNAVKSAGGREKTVEWLKYLENQSAKQADPDDPMATYDYRWLWEELGIADLRR